MTHPMHLTARERATIRAALFLYVKTPWLRANAVSTACGAFKPLSVPSIERLAQRLTDPTKPAKSNTTARKRAQKNK